MPHYHITNLDDFNDVVNSSKPVVVKFGANWCGPCRRITNDYHSLADKYHSINFVTVNVDEDNELGQLSLDYAIKGLPTFVLIAKGKEYHDFRFSGADIKQLVKKIDALTH